MIIKKRYGGIDLSRWFAGKKIGTVLGNMMETTGFKITRSCNTLKSKRIEVLRRLKNVAVLDVGANIGQYAAEIRDSGFQGEIESFEPDPASYERLQAEGRQAQHSCHMIGIGDHAGELKFNLTSDPACNSFRRPASKGLSRENPFVVSSQVVVPVQRLDELERGWGRPNRRYYLKIDTQGFEREVLVGADQLMDRIDAIEIELSLSELYEGQALLPELWAMITKAGLRPAWIERGYRDPNEVWLLQVDGLFVREEALARVSNAK
jgi:FkbM family methyltransferase